MSKNKKVATPIKKQRGFTVASLQDTLWQTMLDVKSEKVTPQIANAVATVAREITAIARVQIQCAKITGNLPVSNPMLTG